VETTSLSTHIFGTRISLFCTNDENPLGIARKPRLLENQ